MTETQAYDVSGDGKTPLFALKQFTYPEFNTYWPQIEKMLDALPHTWKYWTKEYIFQSVGCGHLQVWGAGPPPNAVLILMTSISTYPAMKVLNVVWAAGHMPNGILEVIDATFSQFGKINDCAMIEIRGRKGWHPHLKKLGFKREAEVWTKKLSNMRAH